MGGGAEALLTSIVNNLNPNKYDVSIVEVMHDDIKVENTNENIHILPYIMTEYDERPRWQMHDLYYNPKNVFDKYVGDDFDLYVSFNYQLPSFLLQENKRNIAWIHGNIYDLGGEDQGRYLNLQKKALEKANSIVAISNITARSICELIPDVKEKVQVIGNGLDINKVQLKSLEMCDTILLHPCVIYVGRLETFKKPDRLYEVIRDIIVDGDTVHLYYLGFGELEESIREKVINDNMEEFVHFLGYKNNPFPYIKQADVFCSLCECEGYGMALAESMALGVPVVSTVGGATDILIENEFCGKVVVTNEEAKNAIKHYINFDDRADIKVACLKSVSKIALDKYINKIEDLFDRLLDEGDICNE